MAERRPAASQVQLEYRFDRLQPHKLRQVYQLLVPERRGEIGNASPEVNHETSCDLRSRVIRTAERAADDCQPGGDAAGACGQPKLDRPCRVAVPGRRL